MSVTLCAELPTTALSELLKPYQLEIHQVKSNREIPGSFWGESEAGLIENRLYVQPQTPVHSALHEACHYICMDRSRREQLDTDAGGDYEEENAVCYLQLLLSDHLTEYGREQHFQDMDEWGYTFRLGSAKRWFYEDAEDAKQWLIDKKLINFNEIPKWKLRDE